MCSAVSEHNRSWGGLFPPPATKAAAQPMGIDGEGLVPLGGSRVGCGCNLIKERVSQRASACGGFACELGIRGDYLGS